jgi:hypothetical protein
MTRTNDLLRLLRKLHAWIGLSGAAFGILFGLTGFLMNHRSLMKIEAGQIQERRVTVELAEAPANPEALARILGDRFGVAPARVQGSIKAARPGRVGNVAVTTAPQWTVTFRGHAHFGSATYTPGNPTVDLELRDASLLSALQRLHRSDGGQAGWILLTDAFAFALLFLALSGTLLWTRLAGPRLLAAGLAGGGLATALLVASRGW